MEKIMSFKSLGLGIALTCGTLAVGNTFSVLPAQAVSLRGTVAVSGGADLGPKGINPENTAIKWTAPQASNGSVVAATGDFASLYGNLVKLTDVALTKFEDISANRANYQFAALPNFIDFGTVTLKGTTANLSFNLDSGFIERITKTTTTNVGTVLSDPGITGFFEFGGKTIAKGEINGNQSFLGGTSSGVAGISLTAEEVPEPLTILGSITALTMGAALKKKQAQKQNKEKAIV